MTAPAFKFTNSSLTLVPSPSDLFMAVPRLGSSIAGFFGFSDLAWFSNMTGNETSQLWSNTAGLFNWTTQTGEAGKASGSLLPAALVDNFWLTFTRIGNFDGIWSYLWSKWAITTILVAILLNRAHVFASARTPIRLSWKARLLLRIVPIILVVQQAVTILQALRCQTGLQLPQIRFKDSDSVINKSWTSSPGLSFKFASTMLFWQSAEESCQAVGMIPSGEDTMSWHGSAILLWPLFLVLSASQLAESVASALQGQQPRPETGMSVFEHSLAFGEAETVARAAAGIGIFGLPKSGGETPSTTASDSPTSGKVHTFTRALLLQKLNVPPEVLLICLISTLSHLSSQLLAVAGLQQRYRLLNTGAWGVCFLSLFFYSFVTYARPSAMEDAQIIRYPTVCIVGFLPHLLTIFGAVICAHVYAFAIGCMLLSPPQQWRGLSFKEKIKLAHANMSANSSWTSIQVSMTDDFYQFVLRIGYQLLMAAAEAVYFTEGLQVTLHPQTWLEKTRYEEAMKHGRSRTSLVPLELQREFAGGDGFGLTDESPQLGSDGMPLPSPYARERKTVAKFNKAGIAAMTEEGVGISQRSGRWSMSWKLIEQVSELLTYCFARGVLGCLNGTVGSKFIAPKWLLRAAKIHPLALQNMKTEDGAKTQQRVLEFWRLTDGGELQAAKDGSNIDVEFETRRRFATENGLSTPVRESKLDDHLYNWWKSNGWWGETDCSGEYRPPRASSPSDNFDATSQISASSAWETDSAASDTTVKPRSRSRATTPAYSDAGDLVDETADFQQDLASYLDPKTLAQKQDAKMLAYRLRHNEGPTTRGQYRRSILRENISALSGSPLLNAADEELVLEHMLKTRRPLQSSNARTGASWSEGGSGMGEGGPQCAVCHSSPRNVLVWPCRCLSLCEECRVALAENNFGSCVCCRRPVVAFSRLYVP